MLAPKMSHISDYDLALLLVEMVYVISALQ